MSRTMLLKRGRTTDFKPGVLADCEMAIDVDTRQLFVGWEGDNHLVTEIVEGPHDQRLYAKIPDKPFIPLGVVWDI